MSRSFLGPRRAIALHDEVCGAACASRRWLALSARRITLRVCTQVSLLSTVLYNALTTGSGTPTLGEEYSDLHAVRGCAASRAALRRG